MTMTRTEFYRLHRLGRTFISFGNEAGANDHLLAHLLHWYHAELKPVGEEALRISQTCREGAQVFHTHMLVTMRRNGYAKWEEEKARRLSHARMARYFRKPIHLPA